MEELLEVAAELWRALGVGGDLRLLGGLAVHAHVGEVARVTNGIELVAMQDAALASLLDHLRAQGRVLGEMGGWTRAADPRDPGEALIDVCAHPVTNPKTFEAFELETTPCGVTIHGFDFPAADSADLVRLGLAAGRGQDLVDVVLLSAVGVDPAVVSRRCARDDSERAVARGANAARVELEAGALRATFEELLGRPMATNERRSFKALLRGLRREGL